MTDVFSNGNKVKADPDLDMSLEVLPIISCDTINGGMYYKEDQT